MYRLVCVVCAGTFNARSHNAKSCSKCRSTRSKKMESEWFKRKWHFDPDWRERRKEKRKTWDASNNDRVREYGRRAYYKNKEHYLKKAKKWAESHQDHLSRMRKIKYAENREKILERSRSDENKERQRILRRKKSIVVAAVKSLGLINMGDIKC